MNSLSNSSVREDRNIAALAGIQNGEKMVGWSDSWHASSAKKHPIANSIVSSVGAVCQGALAAGAGVIGYSAWNMPKKSYDAYEFCTACASNIAKTINFRNNAVMKIVELGKMFGAYPKMSAEELAQAKFGLWLNEAGTWFTATVGGAFACLDQKIYTEEFMNQCSAANFVGTIVDTVSENAVLISAATGAFIFWRYSQNVQAGEAHEIDVEKRLTRDLSDRYSRVATRLLSTGGNAEVRECAQKILQRRVEINQEVEALALPSLKYTDIQNITKPVFDAAQQVMNR